jgi:DNA-binding protein H-NS
MARSANLAAMSVDALLKLRDNIDVVLSRRADDLHDQLSRLAREGGARGRRGGGARKGSKVPPKYRDPQSRETWAGRGAQPVWLREKLKKGAKLDHFLIERKTAALRRTANAKKSRRRKKIGKPVRSL